MPACSKPASALTTLAPVLAAVIALAALVTWLCSGTTVTLPLRTPGSDRDPSQEMTPAVADGPELGQLQQFVTPLPAPVAAGSWPGFRGPAADGIAAATVPLLQTWPSNGPPVRWRTTVGEGYAGPAIHAGRVYLMDYDREAQADALRCFSLDDATELWRYSYPVKIKRNHGMSRTVVAVTDDHVVGLGPKCHVVCLETTTGNRRWSFDLTRDFATIVPPWYAGQCPLIDGDKVILAPAGDALVIAVDANSGEVLWQTPNPDAWKMTHASLTVTELAGRRQYVYCGSGGVAAVDAADGALLWRTTLWQIQIATVPSPVVVPGDRLFLAGGYNAGSLMLRVTHGGGAFEPVAEYRLAAKDFGATQQSPICFEDHLYGVRPNGQLVCLDTTGDNRWDSGSRHFGLGPFILVDGSLFVLDDDGALTQVAATPTAYRELNHAQVLSGHECWAPLAFADGLLLVRDLTELACLDLRAHGMDR